MPYVSLFDAHETRMKPLLRLALEEQGNLYIHVLSSILSPSKYLTL